MPTPPEVGDGGRNIGIIEILEELKAEHIAQTASHIGIAREVEVNLEGIAEDSDPCAENAVFLRIRKHGCRERAHLVCDEHLFAQSDTKQLYALCKAVEGFAAVLKLIGYVAVADDGSRDELRKQRDVGSEVDEAL